MMKPNVYVNTLDYGEIIKQLPGNALTWLKGFRSRGLDAYQDLGLPAPRDEEWRYTPLSGLEKKYFAPQPQTSTANHEDLLARLKLNDAFVCVLVNGHFAPDLSTLDDLPEDVLLIPFSEMLTDPLLGQPAQEYLGKAVNVNEPGFIRFNDAWFSDGLFCSIHKNRRLEKPLQFLNLVTEPDSLSCTRNLVVLEQGAQAEIIETYAGINESYLNVSVNEVFLHQNAHLTLTKVQAEGEKAHHLGGTYVHQDNDSRLTHHNFAFGALLARTDLHTELHQGSACEMNGLYLGTKRQHLDNHTRIHHVQPHATSQEYYKGILDKQARGVFQGRVIVAKQAQKTDSSMNNRNLLLSDRAEADTKPQLEIYADDVKCSHGVTVGQLDDKSVFYLQSRGIDEAAARNMLTFAFANEMLDKIKHEELQEQLLQQLLQRFPQHSLD